MLTKSFKSGSYKRCAMILMLCFLCVLPLAAMAGESAIVKGGALNLRAEASLDAQVIGQYPTGTWVEILTRGDTWHYVQVGDKTGYMMAKYLSSGNDSVIATATVNTNSRGLNLRVQPSDSAAIITSYPKGTKVEVLQKGTAWHRVSIDGNVGYMSAQWLSFGGSSGGSSGGSGSSSVEAYGVVNNPRDTQVLMLREQPSQDSRVLAYYKNGTQVQILKKGSTWHEVKVNGIHGYMMAKYVKITSSSSSTTATLYNPNGNSIVNFREGPSLNAAVVTTYKVGTKVTVLDKGTDWCYVDINGRTGYVSTHFLRF